MAGEGMGATPSPLVFSSFALGTPALSPSSLLAPCLGLFLPPRTFVSSLRDPSFAFLSSALVRFLLPLYCVLKSLGLQGTIPTSPFFWLLVLSLRPLPLPPFFPTPSIPSLLFSPGQWMDAGGEGQKN